jgi:UDP-N-acetylglucosamine enolpyruvyl transferase
MLFEMICRDPKEGEIDVSITMTMTVNSPQSTTRVIKSTMRADGQTMITNAKTESKWLSASCEKK